MTVKKVLISIVALAALALFPGRVSAQVENTVASVDVVPLISITEVSELKFGRVNSGSEVGTVTVTTANARTITGAVTLFGNDQTTASYNVLGNASGTYAITLPVTPINVSKDGVNLAVSAFQARSTSTASGTSGTLDLDGKDSFVVGATLTLPAGTLPGRYAGTFDVSIAYN